MATNLIARDSFEKNRVALGAEPSREELETERIKLEYQFGKKIHELLLARLQKERMLEED